MRTTTNLGLTQFDGTDVPNWLDQYNSDMKKIDDSVGTQSVNNTKYENRFTDNEKKITDNRNQIDENTQDIANIKSNINDITGGSTVNINQLNTTVITQGSDIANLKTRTSTLENSVDALETHVGNNPVENVGENISKAIGNTAVNFRGVTTGGLSNIMETIASFIGSENLPTIGDIAPTDIISAIIALNSLKGITAKLLTTSDISITSGGDTHLELLDKEENGLNLSGLELTFGGKNFTIVICNFALKSTLLHPLDTNNSMVNITMPKDYTNIISIGDIVQGFDSGVPVQVRKGEVDHILGVFPWSVSKTYENEMYYRTTFLAIFTS